VHVGALILITRFQSLVGAMRTREFPVEPLAGEDVSIPRRGNEDLDGRTAKVNVKVFQSLVGAMRTGGHHGSLTCYLRFNPS